ncbi:MAG: lipid-A-disaccharide synthase [Chromatiales bacterium]
MLRVGVVAGEPSGDLLAAGLVRALRARVDALEIMGIAGPAMEAAGCVAWERADRLAVMGLPEIIRRYPELRRLQRRTIEYFREIRPDVFVGVDAPEFNLGIEAALRAAGIPTVHYVSPTVWAWREGRLKTIRRAVDLMLALFPFEETYYRDQRLPVAYVGHPLADELAEPPGREAARRILGLDSGCAVLAVLPGSRGSEIRHHVRPFLEAAQICAEAEPDLQVAVALVSEVAVGVLREAQARYAPNLSLCIYPGRAREVLGAADAALIASGTATLEAMLLGCPMVVAYRAAWLSYLIIRPLIRISRFALPNLLAGEDIVPECIQGAAEPRRLARQLLPLLKSDVARACQRERFQALKAVLRRGASERAAEAVLALLQGVRDNSRR